MKRVLVVFLAVCVAVLGMYPQLASAETMPSCKLSIKSQTGTSVTLSWQTYNTVEAYLQGYRLDDTQVANGTETFQKSQPGQVYSLQVKNSNGNSSTCRVTAK